MRAGGAAAFAVLMVTAASCDGDFRFDQQSAHDGGPTQCSSDSDCPLPSLHCDPGSGSCVPCVTDAHCTAQGRPRCDSALHTCVECGSTQDCGQNAVCEPTSHDCIPTCTDDKSCPASAPHCADFTHLCVECNSNDECTQARPWCAKTSGRCVQCQPSFPADCSSPKPFCDTATATCVACRTSTDCPTSTPVCDPATSTCVVAGH